jgi:cephalosporin hydroxylase
MGAQDYFSEVQTAQDFEKERDAWRKKYWDSTESKNLGSELLRNLDEHHYTYHWDWLGVPIIKLPDDIMVLQEFYFQFKPTAVVEVGVARGGGMALASSLQDLSKIEKHILGIGLKIFPHTVEALKNFGNSGMKLVECDSTSSQSEDAVIEHIKGHDRVFVTLDSDHSHEHVFRELELFGRLLPHGSVILVADTIIEDFVTPNTQINWGPGNSPKSALNEYLSKDSDWEIARNWSRRAAISESRDGWIQKISTSPI